MRRLELIYNLFTRWSESAAFCRSYVTLRSGTGWVPLSTENTSFVVSSEYFARALVYDTNAEY